MSDIEQYDPESDLFKQIEKVATLRFKGHNPTQVARILEIPRKEVIRYEEIYYDILRNGQEGKDMAHDLLTQLGQHYDHIIKQYYELLDDLRAERFNHQIAAQISTALKQIAELEAKRLDFYQKAGLLDGEAMGDELALLEEQKEFILDILKNDLCDHCKPHVRDKMKRMPGVPQEVVVVEMEDENV